MTLIRVNSLHQSLHVRILGLMRLARQHNQLLFACMGLAVVRPTDLDCAMIVQLLLVKLVEVVIWSHSLAFIFFSDFGN